MDKFEELVWPAFLKFCSEHEFVYDFDNVSRTVVRVADGAVFLQKGIEGGRDTWVGLDKEFVRMVYHAVLNHKKRITLSELAILYPAIRDLGFIFRVLSRLKNLFRYEYKEKRIYLK